MSHALIVLTPLLVLLIVAAFGFSGCASFGSNESENTGTVKGPPLGVAPPPYGEVVAGTAGFAALWPLNEAGGNVASVNGPLNPAANGTYIFRIGAPGASRGVTLGAPGVLSKDDPADFAPHFDGTAAYIDVPFNAPLNPAKNVPGFSIELWVKPDPGAGPANQVLVSSHRFDAANKQQGYEIALVRATSEPQPQVRARLFSTGAAAPSQLIVTPIGGNPDDWRHVVFTYETNAAGAATMKLYVRLVGAPAPFLGGPVAAAYDSVSSAAPSTLRFAAGHQLNQTAGGFLAGLIDEIAFYNAALAQSDIDKHFNTA